ncbi:uncharacterized protein AB675_4548 [Cyphellophora attinorum]|uniref:Heterokaryon incompatibility domain-containing protein n=1 Tax=Cyphellophora attinorum TaxID=1664694 RepID=A0A0N1NY00_9EURO|nr:uncharacterized protein AB675_4548 [Phialophora attinorum]KPI38994.1 hypothetical protein AB675_4548 [Phialophora attinorum]
MGFRTTGSDGNVTCHSTRVQGYHEDAEICLECYRRYGKVFEPLLLLLPSKHETTGQSSARLDTEQCWDTPEPEPAVQFTWSAELELSSLWKERIVSTCVVCRLFTHLFSPASKEAGIEFVWGRKAGLLDASPPCTVKERSKATLWFSCRSTKPNKARHHGRATRILYEDIHWLERGQEQGLQRLNVGDDSVDHWVDFDWLSSLLNSVLSLSNIKVQPNGPEHIYGLHLIDCESNEVVEAVPGCSYLALSYASGSWNSEKTVESARAAFPKLPFVLPPVVRDAMMVTRKLGHQYLWVDMLCIVKEAHRQGQVAAMDQLYLGAAATIVSLEEDAGTHMPGVIMPRSMPGVRCGGSFVYGSDLCDAVRLDAREIETSAWSERGWTYQEGNLSRVLDFFGRHRVTLLDPDGWDAEPICYGLAERHWSERRKSSRRYQSCKQGGWAPSRLDWVLGKGPLASVIEGYSSRQLRHQREKLDAIRGLLRARGVYSYWGTPLGVTYSDSFGIAQRRSNTASLAYWLSWRPKRPDSDPVSTLWPTWSWLAGGSIMFDNAPACEAKSTNLGYAYRISLTSVRFEGLNGVLRTAAQLIKTQTHRVMLPEIDRFIHVRGPVYQIRLNPCSTRRAVHPADYDCPPLMGESYTARIFRDRHREDPTTESFTPFLTLIVGFWHTMEYAVHIAAIVLEQNVDAYRRFGHLKIVLRAPRTKTLVTEENGKTSIRKFYASRREYKAQMLRIARLMALDQQTVRIG